ncbi:MAG: enoyl-CoA hydratase/isomerase family protein [Halobacteriaceae archaeon]
MKTNIRNDICYITFDRPQAKNAFNEEAATKLASEISSVSPKEISAIVLTGKGDAFSAGGDIETMAKREETSAEAYTRIQKSLGAVAKEILTAELPIIAAVNGDAVGAGLSIVLLCDFAYAAESARFGASFINVGLIPDMGASILLPQIIGLRKTKELVFTGKLIDGEEANEIGIINECLPESRLDDKIKEVTTRLRDLPTQNIGLAKRALHENIGRQLRDGLDHEAHLQTLAYDTPGHKEGVNAFLEGRDPNFE